LASNADPPLGLDDRPNVGNLSDLLVEVGDQVPKFGAQVAQQLPASSRGSLCESGQRRRGELLAVQVLSHGVGRSSHFCRTFDRNRLPSPRTSFSVWTEHDKPQHLEVGVGST